MAFLHNFRATAAAVVIELLVALVAGTGAPHAFLISK